MRIVENAINLYLTVKVRLTFKYINISVFSLSPTTFQSNCHRNIVSNANLNPSFQDIFIRTGLQLAKELVRINISPDRILLEEFGSHELIRLLDRIKVIDLSLNRIPIRVFVVNTSRRAMVDTPGRLDIKLPSQLPGFEETPEVRVGKGHMVHSRSGVRVRVRALVVDNSDAVMFLVIAEESNEVVFEHSLRAQECGPKFHHDFDVGRSEDDVG